MRPRTTSTLTVTINGTCVESVDHVPSGVTLQAGSSGATLQAPAPRRTRCSASAGSALRLQI
jgi:hypothetical protein